MIRASGPHRRTLAFTEDDLAQLVDEFAEYASEDIADLLGLDLDEEIFRLMALEISHAVRCVIDELPLAQPSPTVSLRQAAAELVSDDCTIGDLRRISALTYVGPPACKEPQSDNAIQVSQASVRNLFDR